MASCTGRHMAAAEARRVCTRLRGTALCRMGARMLGWLCRAVCEPSWVCICVHTCWGGSARVQSIHGRVRAAVGAHRPVLLVGVHESCVPAGHGGDLQSAAASPPSLLLTSCRSPVPRSPLLSAATVNTFCCSARPCPEPSGRRLQRRSARPLLTLSPLPPRPRSSACTPPCPAPTRPCPRISPGTAAGAEEPRLTALTQLALHFPAAVSPTMNF